MNQIKFRGQRKDGMGWVKGYYCKNLDTEKEFIICSGCWFEVIPETVGQWTGWNNAYAGDRIKRKDGTIGTIFWDEKMFLFAIKWDDGISFQLSSYIGKCEIISTIHDAEGGK